MMNEEHLKLLDEIISETQECMTPTWLIKKLEVVGKERIRLLTEIRDYIDLRISKTRIKQINR